MKITTTLASNIILPIVPNPDGRNPSAPPLEIVISQGDCVCWFSVYHPGVDLVSTPALCEIALDYYNGEMRVLMRDQENDGWGDPLTVIGLTTLEGKK